MLVARNAISSADLEEDYQFSITGDSLHTKIKTLTKKHLEFFNNIFNFKKNAKLKFLDLVHAITALGGKVKIHDGSKTWIYMPDCKYLANTTITVWFCFI